VRHFPQPLWITRRGVGAAARVAWFARTSAASGARSSGSRTSCQKGTPVCAAARGPVSAAADAASPLDCPRARLGCQAMFLPHGGSRQRARPDAAPCRTYPPPKGLRRKTPASPVPWVPLAPQTPAGGFAARRRSCRYRGFAPLPAPGSGAALLRRPRLPPKTGESTRHCERGCSA